MSTRGYNTCVWVGNLPADPQLRTTGTGTPLRIFRIAVTRAHSTGGQIPDATQYYRVIV
ncbi:MAG TPA: single-stranded DNA-binding protein [Chloroflexia bacterium]|nr:single-stranded DNA-binding protein [Chloroflexia bacterium]